MQDLVKNVTIRLAKREELYKIADFLHECWRAEYRGIVRDDYLDAMTVADRHKGLLTKFDEKAWEFFSMFDGGKRIGVSVFGKSFIEGFERDGEIPAIYLKSGYIGKGFGHRLFTETEKALSAKGYPAFILDVLSDNLRAVRFYQSHGYKEADNRYVSLGGQKYPLTVMRKTETV